MEDTDLDVIYGVNRISGRCNIEKDMYLFLSFLYSKGWKSFIDGKSVPVFKADTSFMALNVPKGEHTILMKYSTPLYKEGLFVSVLCVIVYVLLGFIHCRVRGRAH